MTSGALVTAGGEGAANASRMVTPRGRCQCITRKILLNKHFLFWKVCERLIFVTESVPLCAVIGRNIATARERLHLTQDGLSRLLRATGVEWTPVTIAKVESGSREVKVGELIAVGMALGTTPEALLATDERVRLGRSAQWVPGDAVTTWVRAEQPSVSQRAQWARHEAEDAAPLRFLDDRARRLAAYLSHLPAGARPAKVSLVDVADTMDRVNEAVDEWQAERRASGVDVSPWSRRAKERHVWAHERDEHDDPRQRPPG